MRRLVLTLALLMPLAACGLPGNVVVLLPDDDGKVGKVTVQEAGGSTTLDQPLAAVETRAAEKPGPAFAAKQEDVSDTFAGALAGTPRVPVIYVLYFLNDQAELTPASRVDVDTAVKTVKATPNADISIVGNADATGSEAGNIKLSLHRAEIVRDLVVAAGIPPEMIELAYYGSANPRVPQTRGVPEPLNRRVELTIR
jgi:outer membrane protein OmpA-like peptidoglycan-associated protein